MFYILLLVEIHTKEKHMSSEKYLFFLELHNVENVKLSPCEKAYPQISPEAIKKSVKNNNTHNKLFDS